MHNSGNCQCVLGGRFHCVIAHLSSLETGSVSEWSNTVIKSRPTLQYHILWLLITCLIKRRKFILITQYSCHEMKRKPLLAIFSGYTVQYSSHFHALWLLWLDSTWLKAFRHQKKWCSKQLKKGRKSNEKSTVCYNCLLYFGDEHEPCNPWKRNYCLLLN